MVKLKSLFLGGDRRGFVVLIDPMYMLYMYFYSVRACNNKAFTKCRVSLTEQLLFKFAGFVHSVMNENGASFIILEC